MDDRRTGIRAGSVGIGVTTRNRRQVFTRSMAEIRRYAPRRARIVVVDDASDEPVPDADYRFEENAGIARAKNKCLELLDGCEHIFLFDDDTYPLTREWWRPYVDSPEPHLMYLFPRRRGDDATQVYRDATTKAFAEPRGCLLYYDRRVLDVVGGFDTAYARWGYEHVDLSNRIYSAGLTTFRYADVVGSETLIYSGDEHHDVDPTVVRSEQLKLAERFRARCIAGRDRADYREWREPEPPGGPDETAVLTVYLTGRADPQRGTWSTNYTDIDVLRESVERNKRKLVILHDCLNEPDSAHVTHVRIEQGIDVYFQRWFSYWAYLRDHPELRHVWCVDATDTEMLRDAFEGMGRRLYVGDEPVKVNIPWMRNNHRYQPIKTFMNEWGDWPLLNAGVVGGPRDVVMEFLHSLMDFYVESLGAAGPIDMGAFNYVAYTRFFGMIEHGRHVTTVFKQFDTTNTVARWRHK